MCQGSSLCTIPCGGVRHSRYWAIVFDRDRPCLRCRLPCAVCASIYHLSLHSKRSNPFLRSAEVLHSFSRPVVNQVCIPSCVIVASSVKIWSDFSVKVMRRIFHISSIFGICTSYIWKRVSRGGSTQQKPTRAILQEDAWRSVNPPTVCHVAVCLVDHHEITSCHVTQSPYEVAWCRVFQQFSTTYVCMWFYDPYVYHVHLAHEYPAGRKWSSEILVDFYWILNRPLPTMMENIRKPVFAYIHHVNVTSCPMLSLPADSIAFYESGGNDSVSRQLSMSLPFPWCFQKMVSVKSSQFWAIQVGSLSIRPLQDLLASTAVFDCLCAGISIETSYNTRNAVAVRAFKFWRTQHVICFKTLSIVPVRSKEKL